MKLLQQHPDGTLTVIDHPAGVNLRGIQDAFAVAQNAGDGVYIADFLDGSYLPFNITDGQPPSGADFDGVPPVKYGKPFERTAEGEKFTRGDSNSFPSLVPDVAGTDPDRSQSFDEYVPADQRG